MLKSVSVWSSSWLILWKYMLYYGCTYNWGEKCVWNHFFWFCVSVDKLFVILYRELRYRHIYAKHKVIMPSFVQGLCGKDGDFTGCFFSVLFFFLTCCFHFCAAYYWRSVWIVLQLPGVVWLHYQYVCDDTVTYACVCLWPKSAAMPLVVTVCMWSNVYVCMQLS